MLLYAHTLTPRLRYIVRWFQEHHLTEPIELTDSPDRFKTYDGPRINYSAHKFSENECWLEPSGLLSETTVHPIAITLCSNGTFPFFFAGRGDMGFDVLAASFYLITRYEEYLPHTPDEYGRFAHVQSIAYKHDFLHRPLVDEWMIQFCRCLRSYFPSLLLKEDQFSWQPTYDIDESYAYLYKPAWLQLSGVLRDLLQGRWSWIAERMNTLSSRQQDPYDSYAFIEELHANTDIRPICFFHVGHKKWKYDKSLSPAHPAQQELIRNVRGWSNIGLHPSWKSGDRPSLTAEEKRTLESIAAAPILRSRQHYIRFQLPATYRSLIEQGITDDYSMGYGSINGFRASTSRSFNWYDFTMDQVTTLRVHPFCYMEANSYYELEHTIDQAELEWKKLEQAVRAVNGQLITIWHNTFLGTQPRFSGWRERYADWVVSRRS